MNPSASSTPLASSRDRIIDEEELNELRAIYELLIMSEDKYASDTFAKRPLTNMDIKRLMYRIGQNVSDEQVNEMIEGIHENFSSKSNKKLVHIPNKITFQEFITVMTDTSANTVEFSRHQLQQAFQILSNNNSKGEIKIKDLERYLKNFFYDKERNESLSIDETTKNRGDLFLITNSRNISKQEFENIVHILDPYSTGKINYNKFIDMVMSICGETLLEHRVMQSTLSKNLKQHQSNNQKKK
ncbi:hypothetical protein ABK040_005981 [Willaertia magna]